MILHADFETRSDVGLHSRGPGPYFESPHWAALILAYKIDDAPMRDWTIGQPCPDDLAAAIAAGALIHGHNVSFERRCLEEMHRRCGWPLPAADRYRCSMARANALSLPGSLDHLGVALGLAVQKDKRGAALIKKFSVPRAPGPLWNEPADHSAEFVEFVAYCRRDVETEIEACRRMIPLSDAEEAVYAMSETINRRGIRIDVASARAALALIEKEKAALDARMWTATGGAVAGASQAARLTAWVESRGVALDGVAKDDILEMLDLVDLPDDVREALTIRQEAAKSSTAKLRAFLSHAGKNGRVESCFVYHRTGPGRWASAGGVNFSNLPRPRAIFENAEIDSATLFAAIRSEEPALLRELYGPELGRPLHLVSDSLRGFLVAAPGHDFVAVDYSGIQGAIGAWLSGEQWKLQAMREIIADPTLPDMYRRSAARILNTTVDIITKKHFMRQAVGKTSELALLFQGAVAALVSMAANYGLRRRQLHDLYPHVWATADGAAREAASRRYVRNLKSRDRRKTDVLSREAWLACSLIVSGWRDAHPATQEAWGALEDAMREAVQNPGIAIKALDRLTYKVAQGFLWCRLPSGRCVAYPSPRLRDQVWAKFRLGDESWSESEVADRIEAEKMEIAGLAKIEGKTSPRVTALGYEAAARGMRRYALYGGLAMENACLAIESDILRVGMRNCERTGYPITFHTYDESVAEVPRGWGSVEEMEQLMLDLPDIYAGLPLAAHGWRAKRYHK